VSVTVLIPVHNSAAVIEPCLQALFGQQGIDFDVMAVENGSSDDGATIIEREFPQVRLLRSGASLGFAGAVNLGIRTLLEDPAPPDVIVLLNHDTVVDPGWLQALLQPLADDEQIGIVGSLARYTDGRIQHAGGELLWPLGYGRNIAAGNVALPDDLPTPTYIAALATALRTQMLREIGLFDEAFNPAYFEDADLCLRAVAAGWKLYLAQAATLVHHEGALRHVDYAHAALLERNRLRLVLKHCPPEQLLDSFLPAERKQLSERAAEGTSQVLRQAYLKAILSLPAIADARGWPVETQAAIAHELAELRTISTATERTSRMGGLQLPHRVPSGTAPQQQKQNGATIQPMIGQRVSFTTGERPPVSIVMLTWNGLEYTRACLESLWAKTEHVDYHLVIVDNGSTDGTREWLRTLPNITLIENEINLGFTKGNNVGLAVVPPEHDVLLLNNDTIITQSNWLERLRDVANDNVDYGIVGCRLLRTDGALQHAGTYIPTDTFWGYQIGGGEANIGQYPAVRKVEGIVGACMYIRRDVRAAIGGLDEAFFSYFEDTDYCLRAAQLGYKTVCVGDVSLIHRENTSTQLNNANWSAMFSRSQAIFRQKWEPYYAKQRYTHSIVWHSLVASATGYATSSRQFITELDRRKVDIRLACIWGSDITEPPTGDPRIEQMRSRPKDTSLIQVVYHQGDSFIKNSGRYRIGYTMLETTGIPTDWVQQANQMDEVWVPSQFNVQTFHDSGVRRPIHVVPLGVDTQYFHPNIIGRRPSDRYTFLSIFEWGERKAPEILLRAYTEAFSKHDHVLLVLKVFNHDRSVNVAQQIADLRLNQDAPPIVLLLNQETPAHQMGCLYRSADCFVLPTRGEGWGMPILEAMACGLPTIATNWSAQTDFINPDIAYPLQVRRLVPAIAKCPYYVGWRWAEPDVEHLSHLMRHVYQHQEEARSVGERAAEVVASQWTWGHAVDKMLERFQAIAGQ